MPCYVFFLVLIHTIPFSEPWCWNVNKTTTTTTTYITHLCTLGIPYMEHLGKHHHSWCIFTHICIYIYIYIHIWIIHILPLSFHMLHQTQLLCQGSARPSLVALSVRGPAGIWWTNPILLSSTGFLWKNCYLKLICGISVGFLWDFYGISMENGHL